MGRSIHHTLQTLFHAKSEDAAAKALANYVFETENYPWDALENQHTDLTLFGNLGP